MESILESGSRFFARCINNWSTAIYSFLPGGPEQCNGAIRLLLLRYGYGAQQDKLMEIVFYYILIAVAQIIICSFMESSMWRGTPGKRIMKLQITDNAGNPLSFGKAFVRNIIKQIISAFTSFGNGILLILYIIAQVIAYSYSKKFFHDQLSNTVIGERLS